MQILKREYANDFVHIGHGFKVYNIEIVALLMPTVWKWVRNNV